MTIGKSACFRIEANFEPLYLPLQETFRFLPSPLPPADLVLLAAFLPQFEDHRWFTEFYTLDNFRTFRRLL
jgi:hypothetical protein